jgi:hypothetical protein
MAFGTRAAGVILQRKGILQMPPRSHFVRGTLRSTLTAFIVIGVGLSIGMFGYHTFGGLKWEESFYYASMILSGEGPPPDPATVTGLALSHLHLFAGFYALFSGVTFITMIGVLLAPAVHRFLHRFHLEIYAQDQDEDTKTS